MRRQPLHRTVIVTCMALCLALMGVVLVSAHRTSQEAPVVAGTLWSERAARENGRDEGEEPAPSAAPQSPDDEIGTVSLAGDEDEDIQVPGLEDDVEVPSGLDYAVSQEVETDFVMPEGAQYEPEVALVTVDPGMSVEAINTALASVDGVRTTSVSEEEVASGLVRVELSDALSVEDAINQLVAQGAVESAQPNYKYVLMDDSELASDLNASDEGPTEDAREDASGEDLLVEDESGTTQEAGPQEVDAVRDEQGERLQESVSSVDVAQDPTEDVTEASHEAAYEEGDVPGNPGDDPDEGLSIEAPDEAQPAEGETDEGETDEAQPAEAPDEGETDEAQNTLPSETEGEAQAGDEAADETKEALRAASATNDPNIGSQWGLTHIEAPRAWDIVTCSNTNPRITIAALDLGVDVNHADLKANIVAPYNAHNAVSGGDTTDVSPVRGANYNHGTHVAGILAAVSDNKLGVSGVSYNARVMPIKVVDSAGNAYTQDLVKAYDHLISQASTYNIRVVNISMGSAGNTKQDDAFLRKIDEAYEKGIVTVAAAGNRSTASGWIPPYECYPGDYGTVVSVISLQQTASGVSKADGSNYNSANEKDKNISAPGVAIQSTVPGGGYGSNSGTSMATPHVSAVLALEFAANPKLSASDAVTKLYSTATDLGASGWDATYGWGEVNAYRAVYSAKMGSEQSNDVTDQTKVAQVKQEQVAAEKVVTEQRTASVTSGLSYRTHVQNIGWQGYVSNGATAGTSGKGLRLEAITIKLDSKPYSGSIEYRTHVQNVGWQNWVGEDQLSGTSGKGLRLEAIQVRLTGEMAQRYDVWYRVHCQNIGWMGWAKNGDYAGTAGYGYRLEAIQIVVRTKDDAAPGTTTHRFQFPLSYRTHVQNVGWQAYAKDGASSGTTGKGLRLEGINVSVGSSPFGGAIQYRTHIQNIGWESGWRSNGQLSGTTGRALRLEAIQLQLTGDLASRYDVWYRVHCQNIGWMGWASNGASAGSAGFGYRLEAIQIRLVEKGGAAPGSTERPFAQR